MVNKINIRDVAKRSGVSIATVSHVINQTKNVSPATREKVENSIKELGYVINSAARSLKTGTRKMIGCIIPDISNYFWAVIIEEIEDYLSSCGYHLIIINTKETTEKELDGIKLLSSGIVDGLIVGSTVADAREIDALLPEGFPVVFIDRATEHCVHDSVIISNYASMFDAVTTLIHRGHQNIGYIAGLARLSTSKERLQAYKDALIKQGLEVKDSLIQCGDSMYMSALKPLNRLLELNCSAIVISNNVMAADVMNYLYRERERLPAKIDIIGYQEGIRDTYITQPVGLISQPSERMGQMAAQQMINRIQNMDAPIQNFTLSSALTLFDNN